MRGRNLRGTTAVAVLTLVAATLEPAMSASAQTAAKKVTITVAGISRTGARVAVDSNVAPTHGSNSVPGSGPTYHVKPGTYFISGDVATPTSDPTVFNQTLVVRQVDVRKSGTITLDSRGGKLVSVWVNGKELSAEGGESLEARLCDPNGAGGMDASLDGPIYVKPTRMAGLIFAWGWHSVRSTGRLYDLTGLTNNSLPARPAFRLRTSQLVKTDIQIRTGTVAATTGFLYANSEITALCQMTGMQQPVKVPSSMTVYRSPAFWGAELDTQSGPRQCSLDLVGTNELHGHRSTVTFGGAARGPVMAVPYVQGKKLSYDSQYQFAGPDFESVDYCFTSTVTLASGGHIIARRPGGEFKIFTAKVGFGRWYELTTNARQVVPGRSRPGLLSPRTTLAWRFKLAKGASGGVAVAVTSLVPQGLDLKNRAAPGSKTSVRAFFTQGRYALAPRPAVPVRSFTVQASFNDGKTWHGLASVKHKGFWTFVVHNPSSGFVTLRTVTVNIHGNSSTETIYRAYGVR